MESSHISIDEESDVDLFSLENGNGNLIKVKPFNGRNMARHADMSSEIDENNDRELFSTKNELQELQIQLNEDIQDMKNELSKLTKRFTRVYGKKI